MLHVTTYVWGDKYHRAYIKKLKAGVERNLAQPFRFAVVSDSSGAVPVGMEWMPIPEEDRHLTTTPGCFARLRLFDPAYQQAVGIKPGDKVLNLDLDLIVTGDLGPLVDVDANFAILQGINTTNPCPYNGSVWMFRAGVRPDVWRDFSLEAYRALNVPFHAIPDDQGWFHYKMPDAYAYGPHNGVYGFKKKGWPSGDDLPEGARIVAFPGWRNPEKSSNLAWVRTHWKT